jgi:PAS domain S-box-containing protein
MDAKMAPDLREQTPDYVQALDAARLIDAKYGGVLESTPDAIVMVNTAGRIVLVNSEAESVFGYSREEMLGTAVERLLPERLRSIHNEHRAHFFTQPRKRSMGAGIELYARRKDGSEFPVEISLSPLNTDAGPMVMSAVRDTTERRRAEQQFRGLLESAPDAMVIVGHNGRIAFVNSQAERLFGYDRAELLGQPVEMLVPEQFRAAHDAHRRNFVAQPRVRPMGEGRQLHGLRKDGSTFPVEISLSPLMTEGGVLVSSAIRDATQRRKYEQALQETNRLKSEFLANMSHELRTPLNGILGFTEFLLDEKPGPLNAKQREYLGDVLSSGQHLLQLINDVLDLSKVEAGKMQLQTETFSLTAAVSEALTVVSHIAAAKRLALRRQIEPGLDAVTLDRSKLMQVLYNLLSNAVKFTESGEVGVRAALEGGRRLRLSVSDTGIGIDRSDFDKLFVEFQQLDAGATRRFGGTGLGLALTRKIIEFQGGTISVDSHKGRGTAFTVSLPVQSPLPQAAAGESHGQTCSHR